MKIETMNLKQVNAALALAEVNVTALKPEFRGELLEKIAALTARRMELLRKTWRPNVGATARFFGRRGR